MGEGQMLVGKNQGSYVLEIYLSLTAVYWIMTVVIEQLFKRIEKNLTKGRKLVTTG
jgi:L-cystine transport system permease protein